MAFSRLVTLTLANSKLNESSKCRIKIINDAGAYELDTPLVVNFLNCLIELVYKSLLVNDNALFHYFQDGCSNDVVRVHNWLH